MPDKPEKDTLTRKEKLYNDVIGLVEKYGLSWNGKDAADNNSVRLVKVFVEFLRYLDGHYHILEKQGYVMPKIFVTFQATMYQRHPNIVSEHLVTWLLVHFVIILLLCYHACKQPTGKKQIFCALRRNLSNLQKVW